MKYIEDHDDLIRFENLLVFEAASASIIYLLTQAKFWNILTLASFKLIPKSHGLYFLIILLILFRPL